jgi:hypothetical protein
VGSRVERNRFEVGELHGGAAVAVLAELFHGFPDREDVGVFAGADVSLVGPGEDLDEGGRFFQAAKDLCWFVGYDAEGVERWPVTAEKVGEGRLLAGRDSVGADDGFGGHGDIVSGFAKYVNATGSHGVVTPRGDQGFVTVWTVGLAVACIGLVGLVLDSGLALRQRSDAFGVAAAAARAGAQELDERAAVLGTVQLDEEAAEAAAQAHAAAAGYTVEVEVDDLDVTVEISGQTNFQILPGSAGYTVSATAHATQGSAP